jgi:tetratricopeptide (TPR) repeat protein/outer membrane protein assembly factor BamB
LPTHRLLILLLCLGFIPQAFTTPQASLGILPLKNHSGLEFQWISIGTSDTLTYKLSENKRLQLLERAELHALLKKATSEEDIAELLGADHLLVGSYTVLGESIRLDVRVLESSRGSVKDGLAFSVRGKVKDLFSLQMEIAEKLNKELNLVISHARLSLKEGNTFDSYQWFNRGKEHFDANALPEALQAFLKAQAFNDGFFAQAHHWEGKCRMALAHVQKDHDSRKMVQEEHLDKFKKDAAAASPAFYDLGFALQSLGRYKEAIKAYDRFLTWIGDEQKTLQFEIKKNVIGGHTTIPGAVQFDDDDLFLLSGKTLLKASVETGELDWEIDLTHRRYLGGDFTLGSNLIAVYQLGGNLLMVSKKDGRPQPMLELPKAYHSIPKHGKTYLRWSSFFSNNDELLIQPFQNEGKGNFLVGLHLNDMSTKWISDRPSVSPWVKQGDLMIGCGKDHQNFAIDIANGKSRDDDQEYVLAPPYSGSRVVSDNDKREIVFLREERPQKIELRSTKDNTLLWSYGFPKHVDNLTKSVDYRGKLYFFTGSRGFYCVNPNQVIDKKPMQINAWIAKGQCQMAIGDLRNSEKSFKSAVYIDSSSPEPYWKHFKALEKLEGISEHVKTKYHLLIRFLMRSKTESSRVVEAREWLSKEAGLHYILQGRPPYTPFPDKKETPLLVVDTKRRAHRAPQSYGAFNRLTGLPMWSREETLYSNYSGYAGTRPHYGQRDDRYWILKQVIKEKTTHWLEIGDLLTGKVIRSVLLKKSTPCQTPVVSSYSLMEHEPNYNYVLNDSSLLHNDNNTLECLSNFDGDVRWRMKGEEEWGSLIRATSNASTAFLLFGSLSARVVMPYTLVAINMENGKRSWTRSIPSSLLYDKERRGRISMIASSNTLFFLRSGKSSIFSVSLKDDSPIQQQTFKKVNRGFGRFISGQNVILLKNSNTNSRDVHLLPQEGTEFEKVLFNSPRYMGLEAQTLPKDYSLSTTTTRAMTLWNLTESKKEGDLTLIKSVSSDPIKYLWYDVSNDMVAVFEVWDKSTFVFDRSKLVSFMKKK